MRYLYFFAVVCHILLSASCLQDSLQSDDGETHEEDYNTGDTPLGIGDDRADKHGNNDTHHGHGPQIASWRWSEFKVKFIVAITIVLCSLFKLGFHKIPFLCKNVPESCLLILIGIAIGLVTLYGSHFESVLPKFTPDLFFNLLLPPVILNSAFTLYDRDFLSNLSSVLVFAVFGTLINILLIGVSLYLLSVNGILGDKCSCLDLTVVESFIFSSLISAVDPVAVLAIFEEIHVNMSLYFLVFGESLLNDGVTVVIYNTMLSMVDIQVGSWEVFIAICSFFSVTLGGTLIGVIFGFITSFTTRFTEDVRVIEPVLIYSLCYLGFLMAELFHWSGIISIIAFGITVKRYAFNNISKKSYTTVKYATQTMASTSDMVIFLFLGQFLFSFEHKTEPGFVIATIVLCLLVRFLSTFSLSWLVNLRRAHRITVQEMFVMAYGGLRGAVGFSLAMVLERSPHKPLFLTTALAMVFFTVFIQGSTIKVLVKWLKISLQQKKEKMLTTEIQEKVMDDVMGGIEAITGRHGTFWLVEKFKLFEEKHLKRWLLSETSMSNLYRKLTHQMMDKHYTHLYAPTILASMDVKEATRPRAFTDLEDRRAFRRGVRESKWGKYTNKFQTDSQADRISLIGGLQRRDDQYANLQSRMRSFNEGSLHTPGSGGTSVALRRETQKPKYWDEYRKTQDVKRSRISGQIQGTPTSQGRNSARFLYSDVIREESV